MDTSTINLNEYYSADTCINCGSDLQSVETVSGFKYVKLLNVIGSCADCKFYSAMYDETDDGKIITTAFIFSDSGFGARVKSNFTSFRKINSKDVITEIIYI